jgi:hypothetical protein
VRPAGVQSFGSPIRATRVIDLTRWGIAVGVAVANEMLVPAVDRTVGDGAGGGVA